MVMTDYTATLRDNLPRVREAIGAAAAAAGRPSGSVRLIAVTKGHPVAAVRAALAAGVDDLGENRVEELEEKVAVVGREGVRWHMIGHLQRRKAPRALAASDLIHSLDTLRLAQRLDRVAADRAVRVPVLVQVNTSGEDSKSGFSEAKAVDAVLAMTALPALDIRGLMTMAPFVEDEPVLRAAFRRLRETLEAVRRHAPGVGGELSMGMTNDLRWAVEEGSTMVRIGTALFGDRPGTP
jgi:PLP dependent protein